MIYFEPGTKVNIRNVYFVSGITDWMNRYVTITGVEEFDESKCLVKENIRMKITGKDKRSKTIGLRNLLFYVKYGVILGTFHPNCSTPGCINPHHTGEAQYFRQNPEEAKKARVAA